MKNECSCRIESGVIDSLMHWMDESTCNFMAVKTISDVLDANGFLPLEEGQVWNCVPGGKYYVKKNSSAVFAFSVGSAPIEEEGVRIISAHSDSPCFKIKPNCEIYGDGGVVSLNVEKYGGGILYTWFDRPLSISGRVMLAGKDALHPEEKLVDLRRPVATIPHLAIHFNRAVNEGNPLSVQKDMKPVMGFFDADRIQLMKENGGLVKLILARYLTMMESQAACPLEPGKGCGCDPFDIDSLTVRPEDILDYELNLYPAEPARLVGVGEPYIQSARIDDLSMAFAGLQALVDTCSHPARATRILAIFDNEETGSGTKQGAHSPVLRHIIERLCLSLSGDREAFYRALASSFMISADDAHAWHPNYNEKYDPTNHPVCGGGPVVKINANCKYMTDARGAAVFRSLCREAGVPMQYFVNHSDVAGGSTLGNISSAQLDIPGVDVGCAIWAMHSAAETASAGDHVDMVRVFRQFFA